eukprot:COSAG02_NODE_529_length_20702_cov_43.720555_4_plen_74_part_00
MFEYHSCLYSTGRASARDRARSRKLLSASRAACAQVELDEQSSMRMSIHHCGLSTGTLPVLGKGLPSLIELMY